MNHGRRVARGFTLIEMLVVVGVILVLVTLLVTALSAVNRKAFVVQCAGNLRQIGIATIAYITHPDKGDLPPAPMDAFRTNVLPYASGVKDIFICPANPYAGTNSYMLNPTLVNKGMTLNVIQSSDYVNLMYDNPGPRDTNTPHLTGANVLFVDGHVSFLNPSNANESVNSKTPHTEWGFR